MLRKLLFFILLFLFTYKIGLSQFTLKGEYRPRWEYRHGWRTLPDSADRFATFVEHRLRAIMDYKMKNYQFHLSLQDIRTWGSQLIVNKADDLFSVHEGWAQINFSPNWSTKLGRQEIIYDDHRMFGNVNWIQQALRHDAAVVKFRDSTLKIDAGVTYNQNVPRLFGTSYTSINYKTFQYLWINKTWPINLETSFLFLNNGFQVNDTLASGDIMFRDNFSQTLGTHIVYKKDKLKVLVNFYYQLGLDRSYPGKTTRAFETSIDASLKLDDHYIAVVGYEILSGNDETDLSAKGQTFQRAFNPFYGTNHKFNGVLDYFYVLNHIGSVGLNDIYIKIKHKGKNHLYGLDIHEFLSQNRVLDQQTFNQTGIVKSLPYHLGVEFDFYGRYKILEEVTLQVGYSQIIPSNTLAVLKGTTDFLGNGITNRAANWAYVMIIIKPDIIKAKP